MNGKIKKTLALLLSFLIVFSVVVLPMTVSAAEADAEEAADEYSVRNVPTESEDLLGALDGAQKGGSGEELDALIADEEDIALSGAEDAKAALENNDAPDIEYVEGEAIVYFKDKLDTKLLENKVTVEDTITLEGTNPQNDINMAVICDENRTTQELIEMFEGQENVECVLPNRIYRPTAVSNDPYAGFQWALENTGQDGGIADVDVNPENLWSKVASSGEESVIAIIDSGIDLSHEDLKSVLWQNTYDELPGKGNYGYDCTGTVSGGAPKDDDGHGTHIAGCIAGISNNNIGICGLNKSNVKIMALKASLHDEEAGTSYFKWSHLQKAFEYIIQAKKLGVNIKAVNCSFGGFGTKSDVAKYTEIFNQMGELGIVTCIAAGNENRSVDKTYTGDDGGTYYISPAATTSKYAVTVAAVEESGYCTSFSNYGTQNVDIAAPGAAILSTVTFPNFEPSVYTSSQRSQLCAYYTGFDTNVQSGDLFYNLSSWSSSDMNLAYNKGTYFGQSGRSLLLETTASSATIGVPFTISSSTQPYTISFKVQGLTSESSTGLMIYDSATSDQNFTGQLCGFYVPYEWNTVTITIDPNTMSDYTKSTSRELCIGLINKSSKAQICLDDFTISKQGISGQYGKYQFMQGTSMATPYVAAAVGLISNAYPNLGALQIIDTMKKSARNIDKLDNYVEGGRFLDLKNVASNVPAEVKPTGVSIDPKSALIGVGGTVELTATVTPSNASNKTVTWSSSNKSVADVSASGVVTGKKDGSATITAKTVNGLTATCKITVDSASVVMPTDLYISREAATVPVNVTIPMKAAVFPRNATDRSVTWSSSDSGIASISSSGVITTKAVGSATITCKTSNGKTATCKITVKKPGGSGSVDIPSNIQKMKEYIDANYDYYDGDGKNVELSYTLSNGYLLKLYFILADDDTLLFYYIQQINSSVYVHSFFWYDPDNSFDIAPRMIYYSGNNRLFRTYAYTNARTYDPDSGFSAVYDDDTDSRITDSDTIEASVSIFNLSLTAYDVVMKNVFGFGVYEIGFDNYGEGSSETEPTGITVSKTSATVNEGQTITLSATVSPSDATDKVVNWSTDDPGIATVSALGVVTGRSAGTTTITAETWNGKSAICKITVNGSGGDDIILGDVDGDGVVTVLDAARIQKFIARMINIDGSKYDGTAPTDKQKRTADVDGDGVISVLDATRIQKYKAKMCNLDGSTPYTG